MDAYTHTYLDGDVLAVPEPNTRFWTKPIRVRSAQAAADTSTASEEEMWLALADEDAAAREQLTASFGALNL